jgi:hypothetical protein
MSARHPTAGEPRSPATPDSNKAFVPRARKQSAVSFNSSPLPYSGFKRSDTPHSRPGSNSGTPAKDKGAKSGSKWLHSLTSWLTVSEPSVQALKHHKKDVFQKAGIPRDDPEASRKLHVPVGEIPSHAIRPTGKGPDPEDLLREKADRRRRRARGERKEGMSEGSIGTARSPRSMDSSDFGSGLSRSSDSRPVTRNEVFPFD